MGIIFRTDGLILLPIVRKMQGDIAFWKKF